MSRTIKYNDKYPKDDTPRNRKRHHRKLTARAVRRDEPDLRRMGKALIVFALSEAEAAAAQPKPRHQPGGEGERRKLARTGSSGGSCTGPLPSTPQPRRACCARGRPMAARRS